MCWCGGVTQRLAGGGMSSTCPWQGGPYSYAWDEAFAAISLIHCSVDRTWDRKPSTQPRLSCQTAYGGSSCPNKSPGWVFESLSFTSTFKCKEDGRGDISLICGFHRANTVLGMVIPEVQGEVACGKGEVWWFQWGTDAWSSQSACLRLHGASFWWLIPNVWS